MCWVDASHSEALRAPAAHRQPSPSFLWTPSCLFALWSDLALGKKAPNRCFSDPPISSSESCMILLSPLCSDALQATLHPFDLSSADFPSPLVPPLLQDYLPWLPLAQGIRSRFLRSPTHSPYPTPSKLTFLCPPPPPPSLSPTPASSPALRSGRLHFSGPQKSHPMERNVPLLKWNNGVLSKLCSKIQFSPMLSFLPSTFVKPLAPAALPSASESLQMAKQKNKSLVKIHGKASGRAHHVSSTACLFHRHVLMLVVLYVHVK